MTTASDRMKARLDFRDPPPGEFQFPQLTPAQHGLHALPRRAHCDAFVQRQAPQRAARHAARRRPRARHALHRIRARGPRLRGRPRGRLRVEAAHGLQGVVGWCWHQLCGLGLRQRTGALCSTRAACTRRARGLKRTAPYSCSSCIITMFERFVCPQTSGARTHTWANVPAITGRGRGEGD